MLLFCDESWKEDRNGNQVGTLAAVSVSEQDYNDIADRLFILTEKYLGSNTAREKELKGKKLITPYEFSREARGEQSKKLSFVNELLEEMRHRSIRVFASVVYSQEEVDLLCENATYIDRPYLFLMERVNSYIDQLPDHTIATVVFDDRGLKLNGQVATAYRNFLTRSMTGRSFNSLLRTPMFAYSHCSAGIQLADIVCTVIRWQYTHRRASPRIPEFFRIVKQMEWSSGVRNRDGFTQRGIKIVRPSSGRQRRESGPVS